MRRENLSVYLLIASLALFGITSPQTLNNKFEQSVIISINIQSDSGGICNILGNDSMCDSKQKSSYEHGSDFERLPGYGKKKIRTILRAQTPIT